MSQGYFWDSWDSAKLGVIDTYMPELVWLMTKIEG